MKTNVDFTAATDWFDLLCTSVWDETKCTNELRKKVFYARKLIYL